MTKVIAFQHFSATAVLTVRNNEPATLSNLYATEPRKGHSGALMHQILAYADDHNLTIVLAARRFKNPRGMNNEQLIEFYKKFGFRDDSSDSYPPGTFMFRKPRSNGDSDGN